MGIIQQRGELHGTGERISGVKSLSKQQGIDLNISGRSGLRDNGL